jgi:ppGpp synthetase/RelA/SpoT-type nucleotidyltranferase
VNEIEIRNQYEQEKIIYHAWGQYVRDFIVKALSEIYDINTFLKIPPQEPRLKSIDSLLAKAFHRNKNYDSPYNDITDKVGVRFVVLLTSDTPVIGEIIESQNEVLWVASKDKDFEDQRKEFPEHFTYESVHYIVFNLKEMEYNSVIIPPGIPCEIQIRTLLQHAYAEMSHDTIYKPQVKTDQLVKRYMARSMALVESADHFFVDAINQINRLSQQHIEWADLCFKFYPVQQGKELDTNANTYLIDQLIPLLKGISIQDIETFLQQNKLKFNKIIMSKSEISWIYRQPAVLLIYYLIDAKNTVLQRCWPLTDDILHLLLSDMGVAPLQYR